MTRPDVRLLAALRGDAQPDLVVWRKSGAGRDPVLMAGEVGVLSGAPGIGRRSVALALAAAGALAESSPGRACGLAVRPGLAQLLDFGKSEQWLVDWLDATGYGGADNHIAVWPKAMTMFRTEPATGWHAGWETIRAFEPSLVVINPLAAVEPSTIPGTGRWVGNAIWGFVFALKVEADRGGFAVLLVADDGLRARHATDPQNDLGAATVAGPAAWRSVPRFLNNALRCGRLASGGNRHGKEEAVFGRVQGEGGTGRHPG